MLTPVSENLRSDAQFIFVMGSHSLKLISSCVWILDTAAMPAKSGFVSGQISKMLPGILLANYSIEKNKESKFQLCFCSTYLDIAPLISQQPQAPISCPRRMASVPPTFFIQVAP